MPMQLRAHSTVVFAGDSITDLDRPVDTTGVGVHYPLRVAGEWSFRHPDRPIRWATAAYAGDKVLDLESRWQKDVLDLRPDVVSILAGINDMGWHTLDPDGRVISTEEFHDSYTRLLEPLSDAGTGLILIEPFLLHVHTAVRAGIALVDDDVRAEWRRDLDPKIAVIHDLARRFNAQLLPADRMFTALAADTGPEHWSDDGVHPTAAGHAALAHAWLRLAS